MKEKLTKAIKNKRAVFILGLTIGIIVSASAVYAANTVYSQNVTYDNSNTGMKATDVQAALDETYNTCFPNNDNPSTPSSSLPDFITKNAMLDTNINFSQISSDTNGKGVYIRSGTENDDNPIYYYRGDVDNNNLLFADTCWKIVRTTETGGIKLIYNGVPSNGTCNNTGTNSQISTSAFNTANNSIAYGGYMYGTPYVVNSRSMNFSFTSYYYGNDVTYSNGTYTLTDTTSSRWSSIYASGLNNRHYTCISSSTSCSTVYYIFHANSTTMYYIALTGGKKVEDALSDMLDNNTTSSPIKTVIDNWYNTNIEQKGYSDYLEDTVWCGDRSINKLGGFDPNGGTTDDENYMGFDPWNRAWNIFSPSLSCSREVDRFTATATNGNGALDYPVGLLTVDETMLAGGRSGTANTSYYLYTGQNWQLISPSVFYFDNQAHDFFIMDDGSIDGVMVSYVTGVRPSISLKPKTSFSGGDGTVNNPYVVSTS